MNPSASGMLGILNRAKLLAFGPAVEGSLKKAHLLLLALDASERTKKELCAKARCPIEYVSTKAELGAPLGRTELSAVAVLSKKAAASLLGKLQKGETQ